MDDDREGIGCVMGGEMVRVVAGPALEVWRSYRQKGSWQALHPRSRVLCGENEPVYCTTTHTFVACHA